MVETTPFLSGLSPVCRRARRTGSGLTTVVMFILVPQVRMRKRLDVKKVTERWSRRLRP